MKTKKIKKKNEENKRQAPNSTNKNNIIVFSLCENTTITKDKYGKLEKESKTLGMCVCACEVKERTAKRNFLIMQNVDILCTCVQCGTVGSALLIIGCMRFFVDFFLNSHLYHFYTHRKTRKHSRIHVHVHM